MNGQSERVTKEITMLEDYPKEIVIKGAIPVLLRPATADDERGLNEFFASIPESERWFLREDVADLDRGTEPLLGHVAGPRLRVAVDVHFRHPGTRVVGLQADRPGLLHIRQAATGGERQREAHDQPYRAISPLVLVLHSHCPVQLFPGLQRSRGGPAVPDAGLTDT